MRCYVDGYCWKGDTFLPEQILQTKPDFNTSTGLLSTSSSSPTAAVRDIPAETVRNCTGILIPGTDTSLANSGRDCDAPEGLGKGRACRVQIRGAGMERSGGECEGER
ncbi:hypothetical protein Zmor_010073 [Zophobas morio]|uniref:Uncharacterized protein n=1 Tax=Zophobas morio TaxID=2755281 RepID=A0AA38MJI9_9CUCU|nr:hypothetical protein Zmor_010073 [Zophobas morio]